jgi:hypothetical protein
MIRKYIFALLLSVAIPLCVSIPTYAISDPTIEIYNVATIGLTFSEPVVATRVGISGHYSSIPFPCEDDMKYTALCKNEFASCYPSPDYCFGVEYLYYDYQSFFDPSSDNSTNWQLGTGDEAYILDTVSFEGFALSDSSPIDFEWEAPNTPPIDGGWSDWSVCAFDVGYGDYVKTRICNSPPPSGFPVSGTCDGDEDNIDTVYCILISNRAVSSATNASITTAGTNASSAMGTVLPIGVGVMATVALVFKAVVWFKGIAGLRG